MFLPFLSSFSTFSHSLTKLHLTAKNNSRGISFHLLVATICKSSRNELHPLAGDLYTMKICDEIFDIAILVRDG